MIRVACGSTSQTSRGTLSGRAYLVSGLAEDQLADVLRDLGDDGVSQAAESVHPCGRPISHSTHCGFSFPDSVSGWSSAITCAYGLVPASIGCQTPYRAIPASVSLIFPALPAA